MEQNVLQPLDTTEFRNVIGHFASGVTIVTAEHDGVRYGATISAVSSLCADPPMVLVCLNQRLGHTPPFAARGTSPSTFFTKSRPRWRARSRHRERTSSPEWPFTRVSTAPASQMPWPTSHAEWSRTLKAVLIESSSPRSSRRRPVPEIRSRTTAVASGTLFFTGTQPGEKTRFAEVFPHNTRKGPSQ